MGPRERRNKITGMTDADFEKMSELAQFCKDVIAHPQWNNFCDYIKKHRLDSIEESILNPLLTSSTPFEIFAYNDAVNKGKMLGIREAIKVFSVIPEQFDKEVKQREAGSRKPGGRPQK
jgi:hypothetical protein